MLGIVKWFNGDKKFGFLVPSEGEDRSDIFIHSADISDENKILVDGQRVTFDVENGARGRKAKNVKAVTVL